MKLRHIRLAVFVLAVLLVASIYFAPTPVTRANPGAPRVVPERLADENEVKNALQAGFAAADITPKLGDKPVYMAGFGHNRKATKVHDPLMARAVVFKDGESKVAIASIDIVGFFLGNVIRVREKLKGFTYVLVTSTHNHEGPDTLGLWGRNAGTSGIDPVYMKFLEDQIVKAIKEADADCKTVTAKIGTARDADLLHDGREPYIKHDELTAIELHDAKTNKLAGILVQWNSHPETMASKNTEITADFVGYTIQEVNEKHHCPVVFLQGTVGGLMTSLNCKIQDENGKELRDGTWEKTERYGRLVGKLAEKALLGAKQVRLTPLATHSRQVFIPLDNKSYQLGRQIGVLKREAFLWKEDPYKGEPADAKEFKKPLSLKTEVAWLRFGDLDVACIPGEIYPELVLDKVQDPPDPGADFPNAPIEPAIYKQLRGPHRMIIGLANDEIGYIIPKRQWDVKPPFCYGRKGPQYGEANSVGPETAPILCQAFKELAGEKK